MLLELRLIMAGNWLLLEMTLIELIYVATSLLKQVGLLITKNVNEKALIRSLISGFRAFHLI